MIIKSFSFISIIALTYVAEYVFLFFLEHKSWTSCSPAYRSNPLTTPVSHYS